ncbi:MAG: hypothetical protein H6Q68_1855 [Firmicutes bacterium]|nr:hypothetical protein [Bacillota bacterium]
MELSMKERLKIAYAIREKDTYNPIAPDVLEQYPVKEIKEIFVKTRVGDAKIYLFTPNDITAPYPLFINMHGGGFIKGRYGRDELFCRKIVNAVGCAVIDIDYKLAPEYMFPYALHECYDVVKWAYLNYEGLGIDKNRIAVGGHSAGGALAAGVVLMANESKEFSVVCQIMDYPPLDLFSDPATKKNIPGSAIPHEKAKIYTDMYIRIEDRTNPLASPVLASQEQLKGQPPALIITADQDSLCDEAEKYAEMLIKAGVEVTAKRFFNNTHSFTINRTGDYEEAEKMIVHALIKAFRDSKNCDIGNLP